MEKRRHVRHRVRLPLKYRLVHTRPQRFAHGQALDISAGGLCFRSSDFIPHKSLTVCELELPDRSRPIRLASEVVRTRQHYSGEHFLIGVKFSESLSKEKQKLLFS